MDLELKGKTALVLAAGGGLGGAIARALARESTRAAVCDVDAAAAARTVQDIEKAGGSALALVWDLADLNAIEKNVQSVEARFGPIDILVNITGGPPPTAASGQEPGAWSKHFQSMVLSVIALTDRVLPAMKQRNWGRILTSTSSGVIAPIPNLGISNALRLALVGWSKTLAREVAREGITVNVVVPGRIATDRIRFLDEARAKREGKTIDAIAAESAASIPIGRYGKPEEYADVVAFLASPRASYITGSVVRIDGGMITSI